MPVGKFITIEGIEGAGKSTAVESVRAYLAARHIDIVLTREPGGTALAEEIRNVLLYPASQEKMQPQTELLLMFAARAQHISQLIRPALQAGKWVVSDRYIDASYAYQGDGRGFSESEIKRLDDMVVANCYPDLTFLLDVPAELGLSRAMQRGKGKDRIEQEKVEFFTRVREGYLRRAALAPGRIMVIDATQSEQDVAKKIIAKLDAYLADVTT